MMDKEEKMSRRNEHISVMDIKRANSKKVSL